MSRNTAARWLAKPETVEPKCPQRVASATLLDPYMEQLALWLKGDGQRGKRDRRSIGSYFEAIRAMENGGGKTQLYCYCQRWRR